MRKGNERSNKNVLRSVKEENEGIASGRVEGSEYSFDKSSYVKKGF